MNQKCAKSPYLISPKKKQATFFPRIHKPPAIQGPRIISNSMGKKSCRESIFKMKEDVVSDKMKEIDVEQILKCKYYKQLEIEICDMQTRFNNEIDEIQQKKINVQNQIKAHQSTNYDNKLSMWEIRNEILQLQTILQEQLNENAQILYDLGYGQQSEVEGDIQNEQQQLELLPQQ